VAITPSTQTHSTGSPWGPRAITTLLAQSRDGRDRPITCTPSTTPSKASPARTHKSTFTGPLEGPEEGYEVLRLRRCQLSRPSQSFPRCRRHSSSQCPEPAHRERPPMPHPRRIRPSDDPVGTPDAGLSSFRQERDSDPHVRVPAGIFRDPNPRSRTTRPRDRTTCRLEEELNATCGDGIAGDWCSGVVAGEPGMASGEGPRRDAHDLAYQGRNDPLTCWRVTRPRRAPLSTERRARTTATRPTLPRSSWRS
jgi:hypothetical protein